MVHRNVECTPPERKCTVLITTMERLIANHRDRSPLRKGHHDERQVRSIAFARGPRSR
jgi:hypothetical protein